MGAGPLWGISVPCSPPTCHGQTGIGTPAAPIGDHRESRKPRNALAKVANGNPERHSIGDKSKKENKTKEEAGK